MFKVTYLRQFVLQPKDNTWEEKERYFQSEIEAKFFAENLVSDSMILYACVSCTFVNTKAFVEKDLTSAGL